MGKKIQHNQEVSQSVAGTGPQHSGARAECPQSMAWILRVQGMPALQFQFKVAKWGEGDD